MKKFLNLLVMFVLLAIANSTFGQTPIYGDLIVYGKGDFRKWVKVKDSIQVPYVHADSAFIVKITANIALIPNITASILQSHYITTDSIRVGSQVIKYAAGDSLPDLAWVRERIEEATPNEVDPIFSESVAFGITSFDTLNWNTAYSWGNHAGLYKLVSYVPSWIDISDKPNFADVAISGSYLDLTDTLESGVDYLTPHGDGSQLIGITKTQIGLSNVSNILQEGYLGLPVSDGYILSSTTTGTRSWISPPNSAVWGNISGVLSNQTDLQNALNLKLNSTITGLVDSNPDTLLTKSGNNIRYTVTAAIPYGYSIQAYASGTVYNVTASSDLFDFGTTDPSITITQAGTWKITSGFYFDYSGATFSTNQTLTSKLRRINNTAGDITSAITPPLVLDVVTAYTGGVNYIQLPPVIYTTLNTTDIIQLYGGLSAIPSAGNIRIIGAWINAERIY